MSLEDGAGGRLFEAVSADATRVPEVLVLSRVLATWRFALSLVEPSLVELLVVGGEGATGVGETAGGAADEAGGGPLVVGAVWSVGVCVAAFGAAAVASVPFC